jgi:hypothetical protein
MKFERRILLPLVSVAAWYVAIVVGLAIMAVADQFCPDDQRLSDCSVAPWWKGVEAAILCFSTGLSALLVVATR